MGQGGINNILFISLTSTPRHHPSTDTLLVQGTIRSILLGLPVSFLTPLLSIPPTASPSITKLTSPSQRGEAAQLLCAEMNPRAQDFQLHPAASQLWTASLRFLASTPSRAAFNWKGTAEPAPARIRMPAPGWGADPTQTTPSDPHTPGNN